MFFSARRPQLFHEWLSEGFRPADEPAKASGFDVVPMVSVVVGRGLDACRAPSSRAWRCTSAGMGARGRNFYNDSRAATATRTRPGASRTLYLAGRKDEATAAVPDALVDEVALCGPREHLRERLAEWKTSGATTLMVSGDTIAVRTMAELVL